jgi:hypothetical protein
MMDESTGEDEIQSPKLSTELTVEQLFRLKVYADETQSLSAEEAQILLIEMMRRNMIQKNIIKHLVNYSDEEARR